MINYAKLDDNELLALLFTEEDRLPRAAVEGLIKRGERVFWPLFYHHLVVDFQPLNG
ncbi:MAG: hypothetical protein HZA06_00335 [Nitrospirae bacterium]|nr:hypothetical protein [Nitrospirota bacterium]